MDMIPDFGQMLAVNILQGDAAVADKRTRLFQDDRPKAKPVLRIILEVPFDPASGPFLVERRRIMLHRLGVGHDLIQRVEIIPRILP